MSRHRHDTSVVRYSVVSQVLARVASGMALREAVKTIASTPVHLLDGRFVRISARTLYRWVEAFRRQGLDGLLPASRSMTGASKVLSSDFIDYLINEKAKDPDASIPEIIRRAELDAVIKSPVSRTSTWRAARRLNLPIFADKAPTAGDMRRFAYAHRMQMVLTDGKHFRVGTKRRRRVVMTFLDDATRFALCAVVGKSERRELFARGLWATLSRWGLFSSQYVDNGSAFKADDAAVICARLNIALILGSPDYPEGRGKIERFHQTLEQDLLRTFDGNPEIDSCEHALELRINHYLQYLYNRRHHESLGSSPEKRFLDDKLPLRVDNDMEALRKHFIIRISRKVSRDNIVKIRRSLYEMPKGYAGRRVELYQHLLDGTVSCLHEGKFVVIKPVDTLLNALSHRAKADAEKPKPRPTTSAAGKLFHRHYPTIVGSDGGFPKDKE